MPSMNARPTAPCSGFSARIAPTASRERHEAVVRHQRPEVARRRILVVDRRGDPGQKWAPVHPSQLLVDGRRVAGHQGSIEACAMAADLARPDPRQLAVAVAREPVGGDDPGAEFEVGWLRRARRRRRHGPVGNRDRRLEEPLGTPQHLQEPRRAERPREAHDTRQHRVRRMDRACADDGDRAQDPLAPALRPFGRSRRTRRQVREARRHRVREPTRPRRTLTARRQRRRIIGATASHSAASPSPPTTSTPR